MAQTADLLNAYQVEDIYNDQLVLASTTIYKGAALGFSAGYVRQLVAGDVFAGFAEQYVDNSAGASGAIDCPCRVAGTITAAITSAAITDIGKRVYMSDSQTFTYTATSNTPIGTVIRWNATGYVQVAFDASNVDYVPLVDNTGGTAGSSMAAGAAVTNISFFTNLIDITAATLVNYVPGFAFQITGFSFTVSKAATTGSKLATVTPYIAGTITTGGVLALTSANCTPVGTNTAATAITAANTGTAAQAITLVGSAVTAFVEGTGWFNLKIVNLDLANALASLNKI